MEVYYCLFSIPPAGPIQKFPSENRIYRGHCVIKNRKIEIENGKLNCFFFFIFVFENTNGKNDWNNRAKRNWEETLIQFQSIHVSWNERSNVNTLNDKNFKNVTKLYNFLDGESQILPYDCLPWTQPVNTSTFIYKHQICWILQFWSFFSLSIRLLFYGSFGCMTTTFLLSKK